MPLRFENIKEYNAFGSKLFIAFTNNLEIKKIANDDKRNKDAEYKRLEDYLSKISDQENIDNVAPENQHATKLLTFFKHVKEVEEQIEKLRSSEINGKRDAVRDLETTLAIFYSNPSFKETLSNFYSKYTFKENFTDEMQLMNSLCNTMDSINQTVKDEQFVQDITTLNSELKSINQRKEKYESNKITFVNGLSKLGIGLKDLDSNQTLYNRAKEERKELFQIKSNLENKELQESIRNDANTKMNELKPKLETYEKKIEVQNTIKNGLERFQQTLNSRKEDFDYSEKKIIQNKSLIDEKNNDIKALDLRIAEEQKKIEDYNIAQKSLDLLRQDPEVFDAANNALVFTEKAFNLRSAFNDLKSMVKEDIDIRTALEKQMSTSFFKKKLTNTEIQNLKRYFEAKETILNSFTTNKEEKEKLIQIFDMYENNKEMPFPQSFVSRMVHDFENQIGYLDQQSTNLTSAHKENIEKEKALLKTIKDNAYAITKEKELRNQKSILNNEIISLKNDTKSHLINLEQFNKDYCKAIGTEFDPKKIKNFNEMSFDIQNKLFATKREISDIKKNPDYIKLQEDYKKEQLRFDDASEGSINKKLFETEKKYKLACERFDVMQMVTQAKTNLQNSMFNIEADKAKLYNSFKYLNNVNPYKDIQDKLEIMCTSILEKSKKQPPEMSKEFKDMHDKMKEVRDNINNPNYHDDKDKLISDLLKFTNVYVSKKEDQWRPKFWATEQRSVRLGGARELVTYLETAQETVKTLKNVKNEFSISKSFVKDEHKELNGSIPDHLDKQLQETELNLSRNHQLAYPAKPLFEGEIGIDKKEALKGMNFGPQ